MTSSASNSSSSSSSSSSERNYTSERSDEPCCDAKVGHVSPAADDVSQGSDNHGPVPGPDEKVEQPSPVADAPSHGSESHANNSDDEMDVLSEISLGFGDDGEVMDVDNEQDNLDQEKARLILARL